ncbi:MAG TPA: hypothetical protein VKV37_14135 [Ktedonobacteraceae bacterium]|nr:hypothetical protein [Ktedonobacteraceae bacterium]
MPAHYDVQGRDRDPPRTKAARLQRLRENHIRQLRRVDIQGDDPRGRTGQRRFDPCA